MIQTQLLKADKPYQIITAAGMVGIQVATLIVTEEKTAGDGSYLIDTHSHPVVNYGNKEGLAEGLKYWSGDPTKSDPFIPRLQPEGAVWNKVEVRDVHVLGLVGANNPQVGLEQFVSLIPAESSRATFSKIGIIPVWGEHTCSKIFNLKFAFQRFGIECSKRTEFVTVPETTGHVTIQLMTDRDYGSGDLLKVLIREAPDFDPRVGEIAFWIVLDKDEPARSQSTIVRCMRELDEFIGAGDNLRFSYRQTPDEKDEWESLLERCVEHMNSMVWKHRYGLGW